MPLIDLTYPRGALTHEARTALADELREAAAYEREQAAEPAATA
jgi:hypothetical protein